MSSSGVYVIDAKNYTGTVRMNSQGGLLGPRRSTLLVGRRDATKLVAAVQRQVQIVRNALAGHPTFPQGIAVTGVLAFVGADWPLFPPDRIDDIRLEGPKSTAKLILRGGALGPAEVGMIAEELRHQFPSHGSADRGPT